MTDNGRRILDIIIKLHNHPTAEEIYQQLLTEGKRISMGTVYNNLNALCEEGLIRKLSVDGKMERYDKVLRHDHLVCSRCGSITDVTLQDLTELLERESGLKLDAYDLKLFYVCDQCRRSDS